MDFVSCMALVNVIHKISDRRTLSHFYSTVVQHHEQLYNNPNKTLCKVSSSSTFYTVFSNVERERAASLNAPSHDGVARSKEQHTSSQRTTTSPHCELVGRLFSMCDIVLLLRGMNQAVILLPRRAVRG